MVSDVGAKLNPRASVRVVVADTQTLSMEGTVKLLADTDGIHVVGKTSAPEEMVYTVRDSKPDVLLVEGKMLSLLGDKELSKLRNISDQVKVLLLADPEDVPRAMAVAPAETRGLVTRTSTPSDLAHAIKLVNTGKTFELPPLPPQPKRRGRRRTMRLSPREQDIVTLISQGLSNRAISQRMGISEQSVKNLVSRVLKKQGFRNRVQVALWRVHVNDMTIP
jgi:DNA-binding NarL/FixJ family response regulator